MILGTGTRTGFEESLLTVRLLTELPPTVNEIGPVEVFGRIDRSLRAEMVGDELTSKSASCGRLAALAFSREA